jgi:hypothetical protein
LEFAGCFIYNKFTGLHWPWTHKLKQARGSLILKQA